jgi:catechol 2,3-dioxygenase-like lactoylglutathione lyase family enzyme
MRLQHVSIPIDVDGDDAARAFYGGLLGMEERDVPPRLDPSELIWFRAGGDNELHLIKQGRLDLGPAHFCFVVDGDLDAVRARLDEGGVETWDTTPIVGRPRFFARDPFGNTLELTRFEADAT